MLSWKSTRFCRQPKVKIRKQVFVLGLHNYRESFWLILSLHVFCVVQSFTDPVQPITTIPAPEAQQNAVKFTLQGMTLAQVRISFCSFLQSLRSRDVRVVRFLWKKIFIFCIYLTFRLSVTSRIFSSSFVYEWLV